MAARRQAPDRGCAHVRSRKVSQLPPTGRKRLHDPADLDPTRAMRLDRRELLAGAASLAASPLPLFVPAQAVAGPTPSKPGPGRPGSRLDALFRDIEPVLEMRNGASGETVSARFHDGSRYDRRAVHALNRFMRDFREDRAAEMDARLFWALAAISQAARRAGANARIGFLSGYRTGKTNRALKGAARNSLHLKGRAVDFFVPGVPVERLAAYAEWLQVGGVGHYRGRFVHVDSGPLRSWASA